jgi:hypothetical protein
MEEIPRTAINEREVRRQLQKALDARFEAYSFEELPKDWNTPRKEAGNRARSLDSCEGKNLDSDIHGFSKYGSGHQPAKLGVVGSNPTGPATISGSTQWCL